ncbi:unnamed protein product [Bursaphelenchus xylophilus]|nr:unnamed protein product [Bursaphelenchus xylophilus]CAG9088882.1 unnamed protein product [Bursaphelenchus xylophilus]
MDNEIAVNNFDGFLPQLLDKMGLADNGNLAYLLFIDLALQYNMLSYCFVPFTYRYFYMVWDIRFTNSMFALLVLAYITPTTICAFIIAYLAGKTYSQMTQLVSPPDPSCLKNLPCYDYMKYPAEPYITIFSFVRIPTLCMVVAPLFQVFFIWRIYKYLHKDVRKSDSYRQMQRQITRTLTAQSATPLIFIAIPQFFMVFAFDFGFNANLSLRVFYTSLAIIPLANPLSTILLVKSFRTAVANRDCRGVSVKQRDSVFWRNGSDGPMAINCVDYVNQAVIQFLSFSGMMANLVLLLLIRNHTPSPMKSYKKVLYTSAVFDLLASLSHFCIILRSAMDSDVTVNNFDGFLPRILEKMGLVNDGNLAYLLFIELALQYNMVGYCFVPFTYRYFLMVWEVKFNNYTFALLVLFYLTPTMAFSFIMAYLAGNTYSAMTQIVSPTDPNCLRNLPYYDSVKYPAEPYKTIFNFAAVPLYWVLIAPFFLVFFIWRIYRFLSADVRKSDFYRKMQRQITWTLTAQSVIPLIFIAIPLFFVFFALGNLYFGWGYEISQDLSLRVFYTSLAIIPLANPLSAILLVKNFRLTVTNALTATDQKTGITSMMSTSSGAARSVSVKQRGSVLSRNSADGRRRER